MGKFILSENYIKVKKLKQENKQLKDKIEKLKDYGEKVGERRNELYDKIDKAIEYIKRNSYGWETKYFQDEALASELLEILGDKE